MTNEQRVRTMAGWIGVEISRSRVRTPGKAGYGLYRVRGSYPVLWSIVPGQAINRTPGQSEPTRWTAYAFTLEEIETEIETAIRMGIPAGPSDLWLRPAGGELPVGVPTRWTSAYRGSRTLGVVRSTCEGCNQREASGEACRAHPLVGDVLGDGTVRSRQRAANGEFQAEHKVARDAGLKIRHATKLARNARGSNSG